jgi:hypothetical protein
MRATKQTIQQQMQGVSIDDLDDLVGEMQNMAADADDVSRVLVGDFGTAIDDGDITDELDAWEAELAGEAAALPPVAPPQAAARPAGRPAARLVGAAPQ